jgi:hypothetical protein
VTITDAVNGELEMTMDNTVTSTLNPKKKYFYDLQLTDGSGDLTTILKGELEVEQDVTH